MKLDTVTRLVILLLALETFAIVLVALILIPKASAEGDNRKQQEQVAREVVCRTLVEAGLVSSCSLQRSGARSR